MTAACPTRPDVRAQPNIDPPSDDEPNVRPERRQAGNRDGVRRMRVHDVDTMFSDCAMKAPCSAWIDLAHRIARNDRQSCIDRSGGERFVRTRRDDRRVTTARQLPSEPERLTLSAPPATLRVDMQHAQSHGAQLPLFDERTQGHC